MVDKTKVKHIKILSEKIQSNDKEFQNLQEKLSIDENMLKKIRELKRREVRQKI
jgi:hypothetical protein